MTYDAYFTQEPICYNQDPTHLTHDQRGYNCNPCITNPHTLICVVFTEASFQSDTL